MQIAFILLTFMLITAAMVDVVNLAHTFPGEPVGVNFKKQYHTMFARCLCDGYILRASKNQDVYRPALPQFFA